MQYLKKLWLPGSLLLALNGGCALFEQESSSMEAEPVQATGDQTMRIDLETALEQARQALAEAQDARRLAEQALRAAQDAQDGSNSCQARCEAVESQIERAFQQSQAK